MAEIGQVIDVQEDEVVVRLMRSEACAKCGACTAGLESKDMFIHANNLCEAKKDEWVEVYLEEGNFLRAVGLMYGIPLIGLLIGLFLGLGLGYSLMPVYTEILGVAFSLVGAGITFWILHINEHRFRTKKYKPKAIRVVDKTMENSGE